MAISQYLADLRGRVGHTLLQVPSVAAIIHDAAGRVLLHRRSDDGEWSLPAGAVDPGETAEHALAREVLEETGMRLTGATLLSVLTGTDFRFTYTNGDEVEYFIAVYRCTVAAEPVAPGPETLELKYFEPHQMKLALPYPKELFST